MIAAVDCQYFDDHVSVALCGQADWQSASPSVQSCMRQPLAADYQAGAFYLREMPAVQAILAAQSQPISCLIIDGYVDLAVGRAGLGRHLSKALGEQLPIIGVAKNPYKASDTHRACLRGGSQRPLYVTSAGMDLDQACQRIKQLAGDHRIPGLLKAADQLARADTPSLSS